MGFGDGKSLIGFVKICTEWQTLLLCSDGGAHPQVGVLLDAKNDEIGYYF